MASIGDLVAHLRLDASPFKRGIDTARKAATSFRGAINGTLGSVGAQITALAGVGSLAAVTAKLSASANAIDNIAKAAHKLRVPTDVFMGLNEAAGLSGVSTEGLSNAMKGLAVRVADAARGSRVQQEALAAIGMTATDLQGLSIDQQFMRISDGIAAVEDPALQARLAMDLMGRSGVDALNLIRTGSGGMQSVIDSAREMGTALSDVDAMQVEQANDAMARLGTAVQGVWNRLTVALAPAVEFIADAMRSWLANSVGQVTQVGTLSEGLASTFSYVAEVVQLMQTVWYGTQSALTAGLSLILRRIDMLGQAVVDLINLIPGMDIAWTDTVSAMADSLDELANEQWQQAVDTFTAPVPELSFQSAIDDAKTRAEQAVAALKIGGGSIEDAADLTGDTTEAVRAVDNGAAALQRGSTAAIQAILGNMRGGNNPQKQQEALLKEQIKLQREQVQLMREGQRNTLMVESI